MSLTWGKTKEPVLYSLFRLSFLTRWRYGYLLLKSAKLVSLEICRTRRLRHHCIICQCLILLSEQVTQRACTPRLDSSLKVFAFPFHVWHTSSMFVNVNILSNLVNMPHVALPLHSRYTPPWWGWQLGWWTLYCPSHPWGHQTCCWRAGHRVSVSCVSVLFPWLSCNSEVLYCHTRGTCVKYATRRHKAKPQISKDCRIWRDFKFVLSCFHIVSYCSQKHLRCLPGGSGFSFSYACRLGGSGGETVGNSMGRVPWGRIGMERGGNSGK